MPPFLHNDPVFKTLRQKLRNNPTPAESLLWQRLRSRQFHGLKFRRQQGVGNFVVDFFCYQLLLAMEVDGDTHGSPQARAHDKTRDDFIRSYGITMIRITNDDVLRNIDGVMTYLEQRLPPLLISKSVPPKK
jgi:very-short-patch-repair endonuclease